MRTARGAAVFLLLSLGCGGIVDVLAQNPPPIPRAQPVNEPPFPPDRQPFRPPPDAGDSAGEPGPQESAPPAQRQLDYADGLFAQKQYDLAIPEFEKYLEQH